MRRQKNSLPEKEKNTDVGKNQTDMSSDGGLLEEGSTRCSKIFNFSFKTFDVFLIYILFPFELLYYLCLEKK